MTSTQPDVKDGWGAERWEPIRGVMNRSIF